jgi:arsenite methyltransferase
MNGFDGVAGSIAALAMARLNVDMERAAVEMVEPRDQERFLVIGFGAGAGLELLLDAVAPASVVGIDPSLTMVKAARRRLGHHPRHSNVELLQVPVVDLPAGRTFDAAIAVNCEQFWAPHRDSLEAVAHTLRSGGRLVTLTHQWAIEKRHRLAEWKALVQADLAAAGFDIPTWSEARYRSGPAVGYKARRTGPAELGFGYG